MATRFTLPRAEFFDGNGDPYAGGKLYFYETGTSTALDTYSDNALTSANANPVVADANGLFGEIFLKAQDYKVVLKDSADATVFTADPVSGGAPAGGGVLSKTAAYTVTTGDDGKLIEADASGGAFTVTLLAVATAGDGFRIGVKNNGSSGAVTVDGNASETIDGATTIVLNEQYQSIMLRCDGNEWHVESASGITTGVFSGNNAAPSINDLLVDGTPNTDHTSNGPTTATLASSGTTTVMDLVYLNGSSEWAVTDADAEATAGPVKLAISLESKTAGQAMTVALPGSFVRDDTWAWTPGDELYASTTAGAITATAPTGSSDVVRVVGYAVTADVIWFDPSDDYIVLDADGKVSTITGQSLPTAGLTLGTEQATTSGTAITFGSIPAGTKLIIINFIGVSTSADKINVTIGDSGGLETSGYTGASAILPSGGAISYLESTSNFLIGNNANAAQAWHGQMVLTLEDSSDFTWAATWTLFDTAHTTTEINMGSGSKSLSAELTQVSINTASGAFDAGAANIAYM